MTVKIERLRTHQDARGWVVEPMAPNELADQRNVHLALTQPGAVRGNHFHRQTTEYLTVVGPALVRLREGGAVRDVEVRRDEILRLEIPPGISHAVRNTGDQASVLISFQDLEYDPAVPDVVRDVLIEA